MMRFSVDGWDPGYGTSDEADDLDRSRAEIKTDVELPAARWRPVDPDPDQAAPAALLFVDGVRRVEARVWIDDPPDGSGAQAGSPAAPGPAAPGPAAASPAAPGPAAPAPAGATVALCASYAAGVVCCCAGQAHVVEVQTRRGLFTTAAHATSISTWAGTYERHESKADPGRLTADTLSQALQRELGRVEIIAAVAARHAPGHVADGSDLLIVDGPLRDREHLARALGYIKSHHDTYLPPDLNPLVAALAPGQRTPVFLVGTRWDRHSWYLRLPGPAGAPWAGIVRIECTASLPPAEVIALAGQSQAALPRFASAAYKDARAPQNLYPIAGLERELRRRLGDSRLLYRALRQAAQAGPGLPVSQ
jgi:hypothetical protein